MPILGELTVHGEDELESKPLPRSLTVILRCVLVVVRNTWESAHLPVDRQIEENFPERRPLQPRWDGGATEGGGGIPRKKL